MSDREPELFEAELRRLKPAKPPEELMARIAAALPEVALHPGARPEPLRAPSVWQFLARVFAPGLAVAASAIAVVLWLRPTPETTSPSPVARVASAVNADNVEIDRRLVAAFDTLARLPDGAPVRFRCREWMDNVTLHDAKQGIEVEQSLPRMEIVPVRLETY